MLSASASPRNLPQTPRRVHVFLLTALIAAAGVFFDLSLAEQRLSLHAQQERAPLANPRADRVADNQSAERDKRGSLSTAGHEVANRPRERTGDERIQNPVAEHNGVRDFFQPLGVQVNDLRVVSHESSQGRNPDTAPLALAALAGATRRKKAAKKKTARKRSSPPATPPNPNPESTGTAEITPQGAEALRGLAAPARARA